jgi:hypothetical protein
MAFLLFNIRSTESRQSPRVEVLAKRYLMVLHMTDHPRQLIDNMSCLFVQGAIEDAGTCSKHEMRVLLAARNACSVGGEAAGSASGHRRDAGGWRGRRVTATSTSRVMEDDRGKQWYVDTALSYQH